jgi:hypothetical protein
MFPFDYSHTHNRQTRVQAIPKCSVRRQLAAQPHVVEQLTLFSSLDDFKTGFLPAARPTRLKTVELLEIPSANIFC